MSSDPDFQAFLRNINLLKILASIILAVWQGGRSSNRRLFYKYRQLLVYHGNEEQAACILLTLSRDQY